MCCPGNNRTECLYKLVIEVGLVVLGHEKLRRLLDEFIEWLNSIEQMQEHWSKNISDDEYKAIRMIECGGKYLFTLVEYDVGIKIDPLIKNSKLFSNFIRNCLLQLGILNDIYSMKRDCLRNSYRGNYIYVKMKNRNISAQEAIDNIAVEIKYHNEEAFKLAKILKANRSQEFISYIDQILASMAGNHYWSVICKRYKV